jgi:hypothetical protein
MGDVKAFAYVPRRVDPPSPRLWRGRGVEHVKGFADMPARLSGR